MLSSDCRVVEQLLTVIEMVEVFLELAALQCGGPGARWAVIVAIQVLKWVLTSSSAQWSYVITSCPGPC